MKIKTLVECHRHGYTYIVTYTNWNRVMKEIIMMSAVAYSTIVDIYTCTCVNTPHIITYLTQFTSVNIYTGTYMHTNTHTHTNHSHHRNIVDSINNHAYS